MSVLKCVLAIAKYSCNRKYSCKVVLVLATRLLSVQLLNLDICIMKKLFMQFKDFKKMIDRAIAKKIWCICDSTNKDDLAKTRLIVQ